MARNNYTGPSSALGYGRFVDGLEDPLRKNSFHNPIVEAQGASNTGPSQVPMNPQVNTQVGMNANQKYKDAIGGQKKTYNVPTSMEDAISLRNRSVQDGVDGGHSFYQQGINSQYKANSGNLYSNFDASNWDMGSKLGVEMTNNFGSNLEVGKTLSANPATVNQMPSNTVENNPFPGDHFGIDKPTPTADYEKALDLSAVKNKKDRQLAAIDDMWKPGLPTTEGLGDNLPMATVANPNDMMYKQRKLNNPSADKNWLGNIQDDQRRKALQKKAHEKMLAGLEPGPLRKPRRPDTSGLSSYDEFDDSVASLGTARDAEGTLLDRNEYQDMVGTEAGTFEDMAIDTDFATDAMNDTASKLGEGKTLGSTLGKAGDFLGKAAPYIAAGTRALSTLSEMEARKGIIGNLDKSVDNTESMIGGMANEEYATENAMVDEYTEGNRRIGEKTNLALGNRLDAAKGSNINSGTIKRIKKDLTQDYHRATDLDLAAAADTYEKKRDLYISDSRDTRAKANEELKQLKEELKEQERQQRMAPFSLAADLAIGVVGASNPLLGMGLSAVKNRAMG